MDLFNNVPPKVEDYIKFNYFYNNDFFFCLETIMRGLNADDKSLLMRNNNEKSLEIAEKLIKSLSRYFSNENLFIL